MSTMRSNYSVLLKANVNFGVDQYVPSELSIKRLKNLQTCWFVASINQLKCEIFTTLNLPQRYPVCGVGLES